MQLNNSVVHKPWGHEFISFENETISIWFLSLNKGERTSFHCHPNKKTGLIVLSGEGRLSFLSGSKNLSTGSYLSIHAGVFHSTEALSDDFTMLEVESTKDKNDLVRLQDNYGRQPVGYETEESWTNKAADSFVIEDDAIKGDFSFNFDYLNEDLLNSSNEDDIVISLNQDCVIPEKHLGLFKAGSVLNVKILKRLSDTFPLNSGCEIIKLSRK